MFAIWLVINRLLAISRLITEGNVALLFEPGDNTEIWYQFTVM